MGDRDGGSLGTLGPSNWAYTSVPNKVESQGQHLGLFSDVHICLWYSEPAHTCMCTHTHHTHVLYTATHKRDGIVIEG